MTFKINFDRTTYDATTRIIYDSLERALEANATLPVSEIMTDLANFEAGTSKRFIALELGSVDLKDEIITDLKLLNINVSILSSDDFTRVDGVIDDVLAEGFSAETPIFSLALKVQEQLEA